MQLTILDVLAYVFLLGVMENDESLGGAFLGHRAII